MSEQTIFCVPCISEFILAREKWEKDGSQENDCPLFEAMVNPAITWAPSWQQTTVGPQLMMTCVALPTCLRHLGHKEESSLALGGMIVPGLS